MNKTLIIGSGGREHALAWAMSSTSTVFVSPGNAGIAKEFECVASDETTQNWVEIARRIQPDLVIIGPETPLVDGLGDKLRLEGFKVLGPSKMAAQLEASKLFMKQIAQAAAIPTAGYDVCTTMQQIKAALEKRTAPYVLKADGLCGGKGVSIHDNFDEAYAQAQILLGDMDRSPLFGNASKTVLVEDFSSGQELSIIGLCDGEDVVLFPGARDHKRLLDGDEGPNTGGMGVFGPLNEVDIGIENWQEKARREIFKPILKQMRHLGYPYHGFLYAGVIIDGGEWSLLEINVRFGDPEAQNILFGLENPGEILLNPRKYMDQRISMHPTVTVVLASEGYPSKPNTGAPIVLQDYPHEIKGKDVKIFWAGVSHDPMQTAGGRVLAVSARGDSLSDARSKCYQAADRIQFKHKILRRDIAIHFAI